MPYDSQPTRLEQGDLFGSKPCGTSGCWVLLRVCGSESCTLPLIQRSMNW